MTYRYDVGACDVFNQERLTEYRAKRLEWLHILRGDPDNAVWKQITAMLWNDAVFRMANEARRIVGERKYPSSSRNWSLASLIDHGFIAFQVLAIRKLMEKSANTPQRQIVSLQRVLTDMRLHGHLFTRENYVSHDGLPYDPTAGTLALRDLALKTPGGVHMEWQSTTGPEAWSTSGMAHELFDKLSGTAPDRRGRFDVIGEVIFEGIQDMLDGSGWKQIVEFGNKFVAHAADEYSRQNVVDNPKGFSLDQLSRCHEGLCRGALSIWSDLLWAGSQGLLPTPQFDQFDELDEPWLRSSEKTALATFWKNHCEKIEAWSEASATQT